ncbi:MAG: Rid family hydrolase [Lachnospiraceae bacterium]
MTRENYSSGAPLEEKVGYSRMVKVGNRVLVGGTTSVQLDGSVYGENDAYEQAKYIFEKQIALLAEAGAKASDVIRVDAFVVGMKLCGEVGRAYSEFFKEIKPLFTAVGTPELNRPTQLVEISIEAVVMEE